MAFKKEGSIIVLLLCCCQWIHAQQSEPVLNAGAENQLENQAAVIPEDDAQPQLLNNYLHNRISLNTADAAALQSLGLLTPLQIHNFLLYRQLLGKLLSIYELQAIPGFDTAVIRSILPYVRVGDDLVPHYRLKDYAHGGEHALLLRYSRDLEKSRGYLPTDSTAAHYRGSPDKLLLRYRYNFPRYMSWGIVMEKDAGEQFFRGAQRNGFDFYSAHLFVKNYKHIKALALGDFTVNMGQGLINWQSLALGKGPAVMQIKREGELLRPYASAGEFYFYRGAGITLRQGYWEGTGFISLRRPDGSISSTDTLLTSQYITSLGSSGYHRSYTEQEKMNVLQQFTTGGNLSLVKQNWHAGINIIRHHFSVPLRKEAAPYNLFTFGGTQLINVSLDYAVTWKNMHFFGEVAISDNHKTGMVHGVLISVAKNADLSLLYRNYNRAYQSMYANAFGEYYRPANERGLYTALSLKITPRLTLNAYADVFNFPWLQYSMNAPGNGRELLLALTYIPDKHTEAFIRYSYSGKLQKGSAADFIKWQVWEQRNSWRCQTTMQLAEGLILKTRVEVNSYKNTIMQQQGFMLFTDAGYQFTRWPLMISGRYTKFMTGGTETRMYVAATGMLYEYVLSQLYGKGDQYQLRVRWRIMPRMSLWVRFQKVTYQDVSSIGNGWDEVAGSSKGAVFLQLQQLL
ncbi:Helix-hairpin-helix motif-containing protein [Chitinophaga sp. CF118]|uniref:ComEA family DNA-binding protein n=1 Tax=Chitinophaga sp. CF118 TaxID=1884367 RepID=UPI0008E73F5D|nr:helix-hairpin-helix domain-containing protein [Chitinophaga sp. CF118]SFD10940.1 Helix-hairpin-helix motif-containing protein [Chitinophaga sp. CF118]